MIKQLILSLILAISAAVPSFASSIVGYVGSADNDLYRLLSANSVELKAFGSVSEAVKALPRGSGLIVVADGYPAQRTAVTASEYRDAAALGLRLFVEFPAEIPGVQLPAENYSGKLERAVVSSRFFGSGLPEMSILGVNGCTVIPLEYDKKKTLMALAKVAGFDKAQFGLTDTKVYPLLLQPGKDCIVALTRLSGFKQGRFGPAESWRSVFTALARWLTSDKRLELTKFSVDPVVSYSISEPVTAEMRRESVRRGAEWLWNANLFIHPEWEFNEIPKYQEPGGNCNLFFGPAITADMLKGDGSRGVMEGHGSTILADGSQLYRYFTRADVQGETAMLLASAGSLTGDTSRYNPAAERLLDYLFFTSGFRSEERNNPACGSYGLLSWANTHPHNFYNDDNARCILGVIRASSLMGNQRWNRYIVENILANFRTSSRQGFQGGMLRQEDIEKNGWRYYAERDYVNPHPHFESWMWACYLCLYDKTGYRPLLDKAKTAIRLTMEAYPDGWHVQNGIQQERARMILPLAWLVRVEDTEEHRRWLDTVVSKLLESQVECGAIREELGSSDQDLNKLFVTSNEAYGLNEAPLIAANGDPVSDMLYTCNFAFFSLNEAAHATGNPLYRDAVSRLADFLVRIQVRSQAHPDIDGAWFRAFDYGRWDYWASNADNGWGAWCTLSGWIQSWIVATQTLVATDQSYWTSTRNLTPAPALRTALPLLLPL